MRYRFLNAIAEIDADSWNALLPFNYPFASHAFLAALEDSGCVGGRSGWLPCHLIVEDDSGLVAALPLYAKEHSYGEYVFDWAWADAFYRCGRNYFPKLVSAIPFTPVTGPRLLARTDCQVDKLLPLIRQAIEQRSTNGQFSSWHLLFADDELRPALEQSTGLMRREAVQFHWHNRDVDSGQPYTNFDQFLAGFRSSKRKQIRRERRKVQEQGVLLERRAGKDLRDLDWQAFYACYQATYLKRSGHSGYLNQEFFEQIARTLSEQCLLVTASLDGAPLASSLFFFDDRRLYGRYWGALADIDCLHFEACYYQGIEFAIERGIERFDPGTQGEHKLVRGFEPVKTYSYHWLADPEFAAAVDDFLQRERQYNDSYQNAASEHLPFRRQG